MNDGDGVYTASSDERIDGILQNMEVKLTQHLSKKIELTQQELDILEDCVYMAAREGFYYGGRRRSQTEEVLTQFFKKCGFDDQRILETLDEC